MKGLVDRILSSILTVAAVLVAAGVVKREFFPKALVSSVTTPTEPTYEKNWQEGLKVGTEIGSNKALVKVIVLSDFECPACRDFHVTLGDFMKANPNVASEVYIHYPLRQHRLARPAARLAECARPVGRFSEALDAIFEHQDELGGVSWGSLGKTAGVKDTASLVACAASQESLRAIDAGLAFGKSIGLQYTPTILVNGWRLTNTPSAAELAKIINAASRGFGARDTSEAKVL